MAKARTVSFAAAARAELRDAADWYERRSRSAGPAFEAAIARVLSLALQFPQLFESPDGVRRVGIVEGYPYLVVYRETARGIRVVAVAHAAREPDYWAGRE